MYKLGSFYDSDCFLSERIYVFSEYVRGTFRGSFTIRWEKSDIGSGSANNVFNIDRKSTRLNSSH